MASRVIEQVVDNHLCCGCGACVAVCPAAALRMGETPAGYCWSMWRQQEACTDCGLCLRVCPGKGLDDGVLPAADKPFEGPIRATYWAWSADPGLRADGTSGGVVTALLHELFRRGALAAAVVTIWDEANPLRPQPRIVRTADELRASQRSKYGMSPVCQLVPELLRAEGPVAVVGLPCHLHGLAALLQRHPQAPPLLRVGLFCDRVLSYHVADRLSAEAGVAPGEVEAFDYRHKGRQGWPGDVRVTPRGEPARWLSRQARMRLKAGYTPARCRLCFDKLSSLADLSCGDAYGGPADRRGVSALIVRTAAGEQALESVGEALERRPAHPGSLFDAQGLAARRQSVAGFSLAYEQLRAPVRAPWPDPCRAAAPPVAPECVARAMAVLAEDFVLETTADAAHAARLIEGRLAAAAAGAHRLRLPGLGRLRALWRHLRGR